jgi:sec-independent protein translocase protein TatA
MKTPVDCRGFFYLCCKVLAMNHILFTLLLFEDIGTGELVLILLAVFLLFGPDKIPEIAKGLAKGINDMRKATKDITKEVSNTIDPIRKELQGSVDDLKKEFKNDEIKDSLNLDNPEDKSEK